MTATAMSDTELSALVAEKVMGWKKVVAPVTGTFVAWRDDAKFLHNNTPFFATDSGLALEAALKVGQHIEIALHRDGQGYVSIYWPEKYEAVGTTVARALCFAALRAAGIEVEDDA